MEFIFGCILFGIGAVILTSVTADIFWDAKKRRDEKELDIRKW